MKNLITAFLFASFYCYGSTIVTSSAICQSFDGTRVTGPTCSIGPYPVYVNGFNEMVDIQAGISMLSTVSAYDVYEVLGVGVNVGYGTASINTTVAYSFYSTGPVRQGYAEITGDSAVYGGPASTLAEISIGGGPLFGVPTFDENGRVRPPVSIIPVTLGVDFTILLGATATDTTQYDGGSSVGQVDIDIQLFEDPPGDVTLGAPVEIFAETPEPGTWVMLSILSIFIGYKYCAWRLK